MIKEANKFFLFVCQDSDKFIYQIREEIYKTIGIETRDDRLKEYIRESIEKFDFNILEIKFLNNIVSIIEDELTKLDNKVKNNEEIDFQSIKKSLKEKFKAMENINITLEDNLKELATQMVNRFPYIGVSRDQLILHFARKEEKLCNSIKKYNQTILDALINLTPHFVEGIEKNVKNNTNEVQNQRKNNHIQVEETMNTNKILSADEMKQVFITEIQKQIDDIDKQWDDFIRIDDILEPKRQINGLSKIAKYYRNLKKIIPDIQSNNIVIENMSKEQAIAFCHKLLLEYIPESESILQIIEKYKIEIDVENKKINKIISEIHLKTSQSNNISELLNCKKEIEALLRKYEDYKKEELELELLNVINKIVSLTGPENDIGNKPNFPNSPTDLDDRPNNPNYPSGSNNRTEIGETNESMIQLVESGSYFSVLQGITNNNINRYRNFINSGFKVIFKKWKVVAEQARTNEQRLQSYEQLKEI